VMLNPETAMTLGTGDKIISIGPSRIESL
jgi:hypothetical protein